jgi:hypothetical protein
MYLPQLDISEEASPLRFGIVFIKLLDLIDTEMSTASEAVGSSRVSPGCPIDELVSKSEAENDQNSDHVLEEVLGGKASVALVMMLAHIFMIECVVQF